MIILVFKHPENVLSYIGAGQVTSMMEYGRTAYHKAEETARKAGNKKHIQAMAELGDYPPGDPVSGSGPGGMTKTYGAVHPSNGSISSVLCAV